MVFFISLTMRSSVSTKSCDDDFSSCTRGEEEARGSAPAVDHIGWSPSLREESTTPGERRWDGRTYDSLARLDDELLERRGSAGPSLPSEARLPRVDGRKEVLRSATRAISIDRRDSESSRVGARGRAAPSFERA